MQRCKENWKHTRSSPPTFALLLRERKNKVVELTSSNVINCSCLPCLTTFNLFMDAFIRLASLRASVKLSRQLRSVRSRNDPTVCLPVHSTLLLLLFQHLFVFQYEVTSSCERLGHDSSFPRRFLIYSNTFINLSLVRWFGDARLVLLLLMARPKGDSGNTSDIN